MAIEFTFQVNKSFLEYSPRRITIPKEYNNAVRRYGLDSADVSIRGPDGHRFSGRIFESQNNRGEYHQLTVSSGTGDALARLPLRQAIVVRIAKVRNGVEVSLSQQTVDSPELAGLKWQSQPSDATADSDQSFPEGRELLRLHRRKERNQRAVRRKKKQTLLETGRLACEVCDFDFVEVYGLLGEGFAECHHLVPLSELKEEHRLRLSELAIICANCHRMLHRRPWRTVPQLREIVLLHRCGRSTPNPPLQV